MVEKKNIILYLLLILFILALSVFLLIRYTEVFGLAVSEETGDGGFNSDFFIFVIMVVGLAGVVGVIAYNRLNEKYKDKQVLERFQK